MINQLENYEKLTNDKDFDRGPGTTMRNQLENYEKRTNNKDFDRGPSKNNEKPIKT